MRKNTWTKKLKIVFAKTGSKQTAKCMGNKIIKKLFRFTK